MPATVEQYIAALRSHVGWIEGPDNRTPYGASLGAPNQPWCMSFLAAVAEDVFGSRDVVPWTASTAMMARELTGRETDPHPGAIAYRKRSGGGHVGVVLSTKPAVATIEGNSNVAGSATGGSVVTRPRPSSPWLAFYAPRYPIPPSGLAVGSRGAFVSDLQKLVGVTPDGDFSEATKTALIAWQKAHGLKGLGVWGPKSVAVRALGLA